MIFEQENVAFQVLDVLFLNLKSTKTHNDAIRNFDALSFRYEADTIIETGKQQLKLKDHSICYFPSAVDYTRISKKDKLIVIHFKTFNYYSNVIECFNPKNPQKYIALFEKILQCWNAKAVSYKHDVSALLNQVFS